MKSNKWILIIGGILAVGLMLTACTHPQVTKEVESIRTLSVSGSGQVTLVPDIARVNIGVHSEAELVTVAVNENNKQAQAITDALLKKGIEAKDIQTA
ncbi:MAG TPA: SIMPL domain-containing protein, partial [Anaerolineaceae bacterium]|nr:SIMPL domain-containing protein [Anaerolineaceae bacterium]